MDSDEIMSIATDIRGTAGVILMDRAPVNAINHDIRRGILDALEELAGNTSLDRIVLAGAGKIFAAGADAGEFNQPPTEPNLPQVVAAIEASPLPVVAAIRGACLGGGTGTGAGLQVAHCRSDSAAWPARGDSWCGAGGGRHAAIAASCRDGNGIVDDPSGPQSEGGGGGGCRAG
jgi:enoyl-CoA hydratase/carnithine racemase